MTRPDSETEKLDQKMRPSIRSRQQDGLVVEALLSNIVRALNTCWSDLVAGYAGKL
jgi:hypothetical protein